nr:DUF2784 domain-containing protein [Variovorax boronicumulans]
MSAAMLADAVLVLHVAIVLFVVGGLLLVVGGNLAGWRWVNHWWLRLLHLATIGFVVAEAWLGITCPLTTWEMALRLAAGQPAHAGGFLQHWLHRLLYWDAPAWVFTLAYTLFGLAVAWAWWRWPPRRSG